MSDPKAMRTVWQYYPGHLERGSHSLFDLFPGNKLGQTYLAVIGAEPAGKRQNESSMLICGLGLRYMVSPFDGIFFRKSRAFLVSSFEKKAA